MLQLLPPGNLHAFVLSHDKSHSTAACRMEGSERRMEFENEWNKMILKGADMLLHPTEPALNADKHNFKVCLEVNQFKPEEVTVTANKQRVLVEGNHEQRSNRNEYKFRHVFGSYSLPPDVVGSEVECNISSEGQLEITAPRHLFPLTEGKVHENVLPLHPHTSPTMKIEKRNPTSPVPQMKHGREHRRHNIMRTEEEIKLCRQWNVTGHNNSGYGHPDQLDHERLESLFADIHELEGFKDLDMIPIWRRQNWSGGPFRRVREVREAPEKKKVAMVSLEDWPDFKTQFDLAAPRREMDGKAAVTAEKSPSQRCRNVQFSPQIIDNEEKKEAPHSPLNWVKHHKCQECEDAKDEARRQADAAWKRSNWKSMPPATPIRSTNPVAAQLGQ